MRTALIAGATGLVGSELLRLLLEDGYYQSVVAVVRRPMELTHDKLRTVIVNFDNLPESEDQLACDDVFCCLGTTMKQAGSKEAFRKVDHDYPLSLARTTQRKGARTFLLVSALGANQESSFYYNQVKGEVEKAIDEVPFEGYHVFRPSLLLGPRSESRPGEEAAKTFYRWFDFLIPKKYKGVQASNVARAMLHFAKADVGGTHFHPSAELQNFGK